MSPKRFKEWQYYKIVITSQNDERDQEFQMDEMTWRQWINNALKRSHGIYGEGIEYYILNRDEKIIYLKVNYTDATLFSSALATYTSSDELLGFPLVVNIIQETPYLKELKTNDDDKLWFNNELNEIDDE